MSSLHLNLWLIESILFAVWQSISNGIPMVNAIETLMLSWASIRVTSQLLIGTGCLNNITDCLSTALADCTERLPPVSGDYSYYIDPA